MIKKIAYLLPLLTTLCMDTCLSSDDQQKNVRFAAFTKIAVIDYKSAPIQPITYAGFGITGHQMANLLAITCPEYFKDRKPFKPDDFTNPSKKLESLSEAEEKADKSYEEALALLCTDPTQAKMEKIEETKAEHFRKAARSLISVMAWLDIEKGETDPTLESAHKYIEAKTKYGYCVSVSVSQYVKAAEITTDNKDFHYYCNRTLKGCLALKNMEKCEAALLYLNKLDRLITSRIKEANCFDDYHASCFAANMNCKKTHSTNPICVQNYKKCSTSYGICEACQTQNISCVICNLKYETCDKKFSCAKYIELFRWIDELTAQLKESPSV